MPLTRLSIAAGRREQQTQKRQVSCHSYSVPHLSFSLYIQLLLSQPQPSVLIVFGASETSVTTALEQLFLNSLEFMRIEILFKYMNIPTAVVLFSLRGEQELVERCTARSSTCLCKSPDYVRVCAHTR